MKPVNLLPQSSRPHQPSGRMGGSAYWAVGGLALLLIMAVAYVVTANQVSSRTAELAQVQQETEVANQRAAALSSYGGFAQVAQTRLTSVRDLATVRFDWERVMREVAHVVPSEIWLLGMSASTTPQDATGGVTDPGATPSTAGAALAPSLKMSGCAPNQDAVAALLVRLRKLHDADDVSLAESTKQAGLGGVTADSAGSNTGCPGNRYKFDVTVNFTAPTPAAEAKVDERVPAALGGGS